MELRAVFPKEPALSTQRSTLTVLAQPTPPSPTKRRSVSKLRPGKELVPAEFNLSSSGRVLPPHRIPYVRRTEGFISDEAEQCNNILRGALRDPIEMTRVEIVEADVESPLEHKPIAQLAHGLDRVLFDLVVC